MVKASPKGLFLSAGLPSYKLGVKYKINKPKLENQLFISINGSEPIKNSLLHMFKAIRKQNPEILHPKQIQASVITYWLKNHNLRQVQYMAGHKCVSSTERYQLNNLDELQSKQGKLHPLNGGRSDYKSLNL